MELKKTTKGRAEIEDECQKEIAAVDEKLSAFIEQCEKEKLKIIEKYDALKAKSGDPEPSTFSHAIRNTDTFGNYD